MPAISKIRGTLAYPYRPLGRFADRVVVSANSSLVTFFPVDTWVNDATGETPDIDVTTLTGGWLARKDTRTGHTGVDAWADIANYDVLVLANNNGDMDASERAVGLQWAQHAWAADVEPVFFMGNLTTTTEVAIQAQVDAFHTLVDECNAVLPNGKKPARVIPNLAGHLRILQDGNYATLNHNWFNAATFVTAVYGLDPKDLPLTLGSATVTQVDKDYYVAILVEVYNSDPVRYAVNTDPWDGLLVGTNMGILKEYAAVPQLSNLTTNSEKWNNATGVVFDDNDYPTALNGATPDIKWQVNAGVASKPNTNFVFTYEGEGTFEFMYSTTTISDEPGKRVFRTGPSGDVQFRMLTTDPNGTGNYLRNFACVLESEFASFESGNMYAPPFFEKAKSFKVHRFMDWMKGNTVINHNLRSHTDFDDDLYQVPLTDWAQRMNKPDGLRWEYFGVPYEFIVAESNKHMINPWFCLQSSVSDEHVQQLAIYLRDNLNPLLTARIEYTNEPWNGLFVQTGYQRRKALDLWGQNYKGLQFYGMRTAQIARIMKPYFTSDPHRLKIVYNAQFGMAGGESEGLNTPLWGEKASLDMDELSVAPYFSADIAVNYLETLKKWWTTEPDGGIKKCFQLLWANFNSYNAARHQYFADKAAEHGMAYTTYEAGYHELTPVSLHGDQPLIDFINELPRYAEMGEMEEQNIRNFRAAGGILWTTYSLTSAVSKYGSWGLYEKGTQISSPRAKAHMRFTDYGGIG